MRIILATEVYAPSIGGTERHVEHLAGALRAAGHHVVVATTSPAGDRADPSHVRRLSSWAEVVIRRRARPEQQFHPPAADPGVVAQLAALCKTERADVLHAHGWMAHSAVPAARRAGVPVVVGLHDFGLDCARRSRLLDDGSTCPGPASGDCVRCATQRYGSIRGPLLVGGLRRSERWWPDVDTFVANSAAVAAAARRSGVDCAVASPWIAPAMDRPDPAAAPANLPTRPFVAYVGALAGHKGIATLTGAWGSMPPAPLVALVARTEAGHPALPPGTIVHEGLSHAAVLATLARASITVVPSLFPEPFGLVAAEAMWAGTPVIASAVGGLPDLLDHGDAGLLVAPDDPVGLRRAIEELLADPGRRTELAAAGHVRVLDFDGTKAIERIYEQVRGNQPQASVASLRT